MRGDTSSCGRLVSSRPFALRINQLRRKEMVIHFALTEHLQRLIMPKASNYILRRYNCSTYLFKDIFWDLNILTEHVYHQLDQNNIILLKRNLWNKLYSTPDESLNVKNDKN